MTKLTPSTQREFKGRLFIHPRLWRISAGLWTAGVLTLALTPSAQTGWLIKTLGDKVLHGFAFAVGCFLWGKTLQTHPRLPRVTAALMGAAIALGVGLVIEALQAYVPSRSPDIRDILADFLGVLPALAYLTLSAVFGKGRSI